MAFYFSVTFQLIKAMPSSLLGQPTINHVLVFPRLCENLTRPRVSKTDVKILRTGKFIKFLKWPFQNYNLPVNIKVNVIS